MLGVAWQGADRRGSNASLARYPSAIFTEWRGCAWQARALLGKTRQHVTGDGNPGHFPKHQEAPVSRGATVDGMTKEA